MSIVLPTFDRLPYLREAVGSVRAQTEARWRLIVADDGSTDGSAEWVESLGDARVVVLRLPHAGNPASVLNAALPDVATRFVAFIDSDDRWLPDKLARQLALHRAQPDLRWSYVRHTMIDGAGQALPASLFRPFRPEQGDIFDALLVHAATLSTPGVMVESGLLAEVGGFDETLKWTIDYDLWLRLAAAAPCGLVDEPLVEVRLHAANSTWDRPEVNAAFAEIYRRWETRLADPARKRVCRTQRARYEAFLARQRSVERRFGPALRSALLALRLRPAGRFAWRALLSLALNATGVRRAAPPAKPWYRE